VSTDAAPPFWAQPKIHVSSECLYETRNPPGMFYLVWWRSFSVPSCFSPATARQCVTFTCHSATFSIGESVIRCALYPLCKTN